MSLQTQKKINYLLIFLLLIGAIGYVIFFTPALRRLQSDKLSVAQLQEKLTEQKQAIEGFHYPTEEEKRSWNDSKQTLKSRIIEMRCNIPPTLFLNDELTKQASECNINDIVITPHSRGDRPVAPTDGLPSGVRANKSSFKISFHADYESLGRFIRWFDDHPQNVSILTLNIKRAIPLVSVEMEVEVCQFYCNF